MTDPTAPFPLAIVTPHYNDSARLLRCIAALGPQLDTGCDWVIVDNGSTEPLDAVRAALDGLPGARLVTEAEKGAAAARNRGVAETRAPRIALLDCDCVPAADWVGQVRRVAAMLGAEGGPAIVGGRVEVFDETPPPRSGAEAFETVFAFDNRGYIERKGFSVTANLVCTRAAFESVGGLRGGLSEDLDWCHRAVAAGFPLAYDDALRVSHPTRSDWPMLERKWRRLTEESWGLRGRGAAARAGWALRALLMPVSALAHAPRVLRNATLAGEEKRAALGTLFRLRLRRCGWMLAQAAGRAI